eukprot:CAMPEP_0197542670 /NCGR_PEP_ID=MMETSP1318-20131121/67830_1 /TAXON_ID=552666 /ORGANISM="Partenskyella glossopodia, Strain RCC365" /LENGTH=253 /DNA_ID=CAMNT_0043101953 /DNA_START=84 /DNA_END=845 /DNA_ORIENTATION=+
MALNKIEKLRKKSADIDAFLKSFPRKKPKYPLPEPTHGCKLSAFQPGSDIDSRTCKSEFDQGYYTIKCIIGQSPKWYPDSNLTSWAIEVGVDGKPNITSSQNAYQFNKANKWRYRITKPKSKCGRSCTNAGVGTYIQPQYLNDPKCNQHPDFGWSITGSEKSGWIGFKLPKLTKGIVYVCNKEKGKGMSVFKASPPQILIDGFRLPSEPDYTARMLRTCIKVLDLRDFGGQSPVLSLKAKGNREFEIWAIVTQ